MNLIKKIINKVIKQRKLEQKFADENIMSYRFIDYVKAKVNYLNWFSKKKKFRTVEDYKKEKYGM